DSYLAIALVSMVLTGLVVWIGWPWVLRWGTWLVCRLFGRTGILGPIGSHQLEWDEQGLRESSPRRTTTRSWDQLARAEESSDHLILFLNPVVAVIVPKRAVAGIAEVAAFARDQVVSRRPR
ncbi:MAG: YcxB family protein, partial [Propionibacteriaceae bacterium]|nr:YcxB family protein [Propionibacteriaceae bacterium]